MRSAIQHFAAGVVFAVVAVELLPDLRKEHRLWEVGLTFALGVAVMLGLRRLTERKDQAESARGRLPWGLLVAVGVDLLLDGLLLGIGFAAGAKEGTLLGLALAAECLSLGLATSATLVKGGGGWARPVAVSAALAAVFVTGAAGGTAGLRTLPPHVLSGVLSFGCAALLYLVTEELLVEAHETAERPAATVMFFAGFLLFLLMGMTPA